VDSSGATRVARLSKSWILGLVAVSPQVPKSSGDHDDPRWTPKTGNQSTPEKPQLTETAETLTWARKSGSVAGMSNVLDDEKQQQIRALGCLGWTLSRIQEATGTRRETISGYLKGLARKLRRGC
jgi:hypothetical protein